MRKKTAKFDKERSENRKASPRRIKLEEKYRKKFGMFLITSDGSAANTLSWITKGADVMDVCAYIEGIIAEVNSGDLNNVESLLVSQAYTLNTVFHAHIVRAGEASTIEVAQFHADVALRAQNQCLRTLRTLLEFKNPKRATFIRQQNNLQINQSEEKSEKVANPANELLEVGHGSRLDPRAQAHAIRGDTPLAALEASQGTKD